MLGPDLEAIVGQVRTLALAGDPEGVTAAAQLLTVAMRPGDRETETS